MEEYIGKTLRDLPPKYDITKVKVEIPDDVQWLTGYKFKEGYIVSLHVNGTGLFVSSDPPSGEIRMEPVYPPTRESVLDWKIVGFEETK